MNLRVCQHCKKRLPISASPCRVFCSAECNRANDEAERKRVSAIKAETARRIKEFMDSLKVQPPRTCLQCTKPVPVRRTKFCSKVCCDKFQKSKHPEMSWQEEDESRLGPLYFREPEGLREYLGIGVKVPAKPRAKSLAECEALYIGRK